MVLHLQRGLTDWALEERLCPSVGWEILSTEMQQSYNLCEPVFRTDKALSPVSECSLGRQTVCLFGWLLLFFLFPFLILEAGSHSIV